MIVEAGRVLKADEHHVPALKVRNAGVEDVLDGRQTRVQLARCAAPQPLRLHVAQEAAHIDERSAGQARDHRQERGGLAGEGIRCHLHVRKRGVRVQNGLKDTVHAFVPVVAKLPENAAGSIPARPSP
jgi:hypothetical protein